MILRFILLFLAIWLPLLALWVGCGIWAVRGAGRKRRARLRLVRQ